MTEPEIGAGDIVSALVEYLSTDAAIAEAVEDPGRVYGWELPDDQAEHMPRTALVIGEAGGYHEGLPEVLDRARVDVRAYGATHDQAKRLAVLVRLALKRLTRWTSELGLVVHAPRPSGGYIPLREPSGSWPLVLRSYTVLYDETQAAT